MAFVPKSRAGKIVVVIWLLACVGVLLLAYSGRDSRDTDIVVVVSLLALSFPISVAVSAVLTGIFYVLLEHWGIEVPGGFTFNAVTWVLFVAAGYAQWVVIIPRL